CRFFMLDDAGDSSVGFPARSYWALTEDQSGTVLSDLLAANSSQPYAAPQPVAASPSIVPSEGVTNESLWAAYLLMKDQVPFFGKEAAIANARALLAQSAPAAIDVRDELMKVRELT